MSNPSSPPKPKPGSLRDRIAAFEQKPASSPAPPPAPRPKPGNLSQWKPRPPSPHDPQPVVERNETSMSASDAKESITKGGSLKERMAALQGLGVFGGGPAAAAAPPPKPAEKPKWKPPPQVAVVPPVAGDDDNGEDAEADNKPAISPLRSPSDDIAAALSKHPQPAPIQEGQSEVEGEAPVAGEDVHDPDEEERQRRAAIAARMARLGGMKVGMGPPIFGRKPEIKPKPAIYASESTKEEPTITNVPVAEPALRSEDDDEHAHAEPVSPPTNETSTETLSPQPEVASSDYVAHQPANSASPNIPPRAMPVPQGPRRAPPPRKKSSQKQTPAGAEPVASSPEKGATTESQSTPTPLQGDVEPEVRATDPDADDVHLSDLADKSLDLTEQSSSVAVPPVLSPEEELAPAPPRPASPPLEPQPDSLDNLDVDPSLTQAPDDIAEPTVPSYSTASQIKQEETETEEVAIPHGSDDEALVAAEEEEVDDDTDRGQGVAGHVEEMGGEEHPYISSAAIAVENHPAASAAPSEPVVYAGLQQDGGVTAVDEDDGNDESDPHTQAPQHALGDKSQDDLEGEADYDDAHTRVPHEEAVGAFSQAAEIRQPSVANEGERVVAASSPRSTVHGQHATDDSETAQAPDERVSLAPTDNTSDDEMAPPRVTRPLPPDPPAPVSGDLASALARAPPPPIVPKRTSLPPPARTVPVPFTDSPTRVPSSSPQRAPMAKRASLAPPSREIPSPAAGSRDMASLLPQPSTRRTSLPPPTRAAPSPSVSREGSLIPPPPPPPPPGLSYSERDSREAGQTREATQIQDEHVATPPHVTTPTRKPTVPPPVPDGRRNVESRRSADSPSSHEERRSSVQHATPIAPPIPGPISTPSKKRVPPSLPLEKEVLDEDIGDPIDPRFHTPAKSPSIPQIPRSPSPMSGTDPVSSIPPSTPPATPPPHSSVDESGRETMQRRATIAERMAKLGGIKFGAPPPVNRVQPSGPTQSEEDAGTEGSAAGSGQPVPEEEETEEDEQARRQRIAAKIAGMGGMRFGMLPTQPSIAPVSTPPPPSIPVRSEEEATSRSPPSRRDIVPPRQPTAYHHESEQEYELPSSSDDGVKVEAEESELEEVGHEDLEDEYDNGGVEEETPVVPPPPPPRSTRPPIPTTRPPIPPSLLPGRSGSITTIMPIPRPPVRQPASDFVMVDPDEAPLPSPTRQSRVPSHQWSVHPPQESSGSDLAGSGQWELPSIPSGSLDLGTGDLSGSMWSEDSTAYPPVVPSRPSISPPPPPPLAGGAVQQPVIPRPRTPAVVPSQMTSEDLRALWGRVGTHVREAALRLLDVSKHSLVGNGSYEGFIGEALALVPNALTPQKPGEYGILIYAQTGAQVHTRVTDILPGDVVVLDGAKLKGYKGLHTYSISAGEAAPCMGIVSEFDVKKLKLKALQANQRVGQATVESVSYRLEDLKSGTIKVYRVREA